MGVGQGWWGWIGVGGGGLRVGVECSKGGLVGWVDRVYE